MKARVEIDTHLNNTFMPYAMTTIVDRALPDITDGCKPVHRRILYAMKQKGIVFTRDRAKSSEPVSETMKIHGHGDSSIYDALALMTEQNETLLYPFIDGEGAFGKVYNKDKPSASRYTFCRLNKFAEQMFDNIDKGVVDFIEEGGHKQPLALPTTFPNILIKPNSGISVGMACNFPSFNLGEICKATIAIIEDETCDLTDFITAPDFSTGGEWIKNVQELSNVIENGRGSFRLRSKYLYREEDNCIEVYEIPYSTTADAIIDKVSQIIKGGRFKEIVDIRDETGWDDTLEKEMLKIAIEIKKKANPIVVMEYLFKNSPLESNFSVNMNSLSNNVPSVRGVRETIKLWLEYRKQCVKKALNFDLNKLRKEFVLLKGLQSIVSNIDEAISIIRGAKTDDEAIKSLMNVFNINETQANYIADIKLRNLNEEFINKKLQRLDEVTRLGKETSDTISSEEKINDIIKSQLNSVAKEFIQPRRTQIVEPTEVISIPKEETIENYNCYITLTKEGYVKKHLRPSDSHKVKDGDEITIQEQTTNKAEIVCFTNKGNTYTIKAHTLETTQPSSLGNYIPTLLPLDKDETIIYSIVTTDYEGWVIFGFENGKVAKVPLLQYKSTRTKLQNSYNMNAQLVHISHIIEDGLMLAESSIGKLLIFETKKIASKSSRATQGVNVMKSREDSTMFGLKIIDSSMVQEDIIKYYSTKTLSSVGTFRKSEHKDIL